MAPGALAMFKQKEAAMTKTDTPIIVDTLAVLNAIDALCGRFVTTVVEAKGTTVNIRIHSGRIQLLVQPVCEL
eukprot:COSAG01_NODE_924_length_12710_cov_10.895567_12_plen_73_part_00